MFDIGGGNGRKSVRIRRGCRTKFGAASAHTRKPSRNFPCYIRSYSIRIGWEKAGCVLRGYGDNGKRLDVYSGGTATIPPGVPHAFINRSEDGSVIHFELLPSDNSEDFFHKLVTGEFEDLPKFFEDHGLKLLGPPIQ
jgi:hypothetical protein